MLHDSALTEKARQLDAEQTPYALATVIRCKPPTSAKPGYKALVTGAGAIYGWVGGGCVQPAVIKTARKCLGDGQPQLIRVSSVEDADTEIDTADFKSACYSGGTLDIFIEPVVSRPALLLLGSSEVARSLAALAHYAGFYVAVASPAADPANFPLVDQLIQDFDVGKAMFSDTPLVVVATQGKGDLPALQAALAIDTFHRAFIASKRKADKLKQVLIDKGHDPQAVAAIVAPAGLDIGAKSPEEIAVAVLAGLVAARRRELDSAAGRQGLENNRVTAETVIDEHAPAGQVTVESGCCGKNTVS